jgi:homoserine kinase
MPSLKLVAPASTANLGPGFDTLALAVELHAALTVEESEGEALEIRFGGPEGDIGVAAKTAAFSEAFARACDEIGRSAPPVRLTVESAIPIARGMGSSAAVRLLAAACANTLAGDLLGRDDLFRLVAELEGHPDNAAAAVYGGLVLAGRAGSSKIEVLRLEPPPGLGVVVAVPEKELLTSTARAALPASIPHRDAALAANHAAAVVAAFTSGDLDALRWAMTDSLHQPYRAPLTPGAEAAIAAALGAGAHGAALSGAGPSVAAFTTDGAEAIGGAMVGAFAEAGIKTTWRALRVDHQGLVVQREG